MHTLIEAALRSILVGLVVALGLRIFRVRNVPVRKAAWCLVLVAAFTMPLLVPLTARWQALPPNATLVLPAHPMTLLEELQARIQAKSASERRPPAFAMPAPVNPQAKDSPVTEPGISRNQRGEAATPSRRRDSGIGSTERRTADSAGPVTAMRHLLPRRLPLSRLVFWSYSAVAMLFLLRIALGLLTTLRLWRSGIPVPAYRVSCISPVLGVRASDKVSSPITIGSAVLLPANYEAWDDEKFRIVLTHERSHVRQCDFYVQLLAAIYAAVVWFSPLGWWLKRELAELAEAISDRAGIQAAQSRVSYAEVLLEFAAAPRPTAIGVAMARPGSLARRIERLLNDHAFRQSFANGRRALVAVVLVPVAIFAATAMVRVEAAPVVRSLSHALAKVTPLAPQLETDAAEPQAGEPQIDEESVAGESFDVPATPGLSSDSVSVPEPETLTVGEEIAMADPPAPLRIPVAAVAHVAVADGDEDGGRTLSFDRNLSVNGDAQLIVSTGSGNIHLVPGAGGQVHVHGKIHIGRSGDEEEGRRIAANPPIEQNGNEIQVGRHEEHWHGISIDYDIEAPAGAMLAANSGSGNIVDEGVGQNAKLETGSGDIEAKSLKGPFVVKTGSGNITAEQVGQGDVRADTGSGDITIKEVHGGVHAQTGSGNIKASGTPSSPWTLETGSGDVEVWAGSSPLTLDASTGSGSVTTDHEMLVQGSLNHHHIVGSINGGGPAVRVQTGSGDVHVH